MELNELMEIDFDGFAEQVMKNPHICFDKDFAVDLETFQNKLSDKNSMQKTS
jgi:hypothetical protein